MTGSPASRDRATALLAACRTRGLTIATAESCTGGMIAALLTAIAGSSDVVLGGIVSYSNDLKHDLLGVPRAVLEEHGAVSRQVAVAMATGLLERTRCSLAISVTGIAGPGGGQRDKPVGTVWLAVAGGGIPAAATHRLFAGDRDAIRCAAVNESLALLLDQALLVAPA